LNRATLTVGARLTSTLRAKGGYVFDQRVAVDGEVFDMVGHGLFAAADYVAGPSLNIYLRHDVSVGQVVSTVTPNARVINASQAVELDPVFGLADAPVAVGLRKNTRTRAAYRLDATSHSTRAGFNYALDSTTSFDLSASALFVRGQGNNDYRSMSVSGALLYRLR
jgi:hypothetical protein